MRKYFACFSSSRLLVALQYGQYDFEKTTTLLPSIICWAFCFAADMAAGDAGGEPKNKRRRVLVKAMLGV